MSSGQACVSYIQNASLKQPVTASSPERSGTPLQPSNKNTHTPTKSGGMRSHKVGNGSPSRPRESPSKLTPSKPVPSRFNTPSKLGTDSETSAVSDALVSPARSPIKAPVSPVFSPSRFSNHATDAVLQKQHADAVSKLSSITSDYKHLEEELIRKSKKIAELTQKVSGSEKLLRTMEDERRKARDLQAQEIAFYKDSLDELQRVNLRLSSKLEANSASTEARIHEAETKYVSLLRSYKALQSNLELEQNSKALLIDQIEYLTKERDFLLQNSNQHKSMETSLHNSLGSEHMDILNNSDFDASDFESENSDGSVHGTDLLMSFRELKADDFESSSPIKSQTLKQTDFQKQATLQNPNSTEDSMSSSNSFEVSQNYQFPAPVSAFRTPSFPGRTPPSPEASAKANKRQSLPAKFKTHEESELVLFPMKLASQANLSYFEEHPSTGSSAVPKRHSTTTSQRFSKGSHSRYSSHDIIPIKVEFEAEQNIGSVLSAYAQNELSSVTECHNPIKDSCDEAFMKLNGYSRVSARESATASSSKRSSVISKRSSVWSDANLSSGDVTKQEITKLKFELQSLKLHNEKLLSYIGFELQKQKKNIKKLSSKQNLRGRNTSKSMEYSDAKLIEKSKDMLIHKKRVLRSVSINPTTIARAKTKLDSVGLGAPGQGIDEDESFAFKSHFISSIHGKSNCKSNLDTQSVKKYKSQTFRGPNTHYLFGEESDSSVAETGEEFDMGIDDDSRANEWDTSSDGSAVSDVDFNKLNRYNQMRYMIFGKEHMQKEKEIETIADEGLKYKFLTIALGIIVVAVQVTSSAPHQNR